jgi:DNA helicase-2/ATP-dependent DNA helicase PcrA
VPSSFSRRSARQPTPTAASFFPGQRVRHGTFGEGVVVHSQLIEGDEEVIVNFETKGEKKLLASFARLEHAD